jgi:hypothetical protein
MNPIKGTVIVIVGIRHADHMAPYIRKTLQLTSLTIGGRSVGVAGFYLFLILKQLNSLTQQ